MTAALKTNLVDEFKLLASEGRLQGRFPGLDIGLYHKHLPGYSKTDIEHAAISPANMLARKNRGDSTNKPMLIGSLFHSRLELHGNDEEFKKLFIVMPEFAGTGSKAAKAKWLEENKGLTVIDQSDAEMIENMYAGVLANPQSRALLEADGHCEESIFWKDTDSGVLCKTRPDKRIPNFYGSPLVVDWKSIGQFSRHNIANAIAEYNYNVSAAFTPDGLRAVDIEPGPFVFVFVEKAEPNRVLCVPANEFDVQAGRDVYRKALIKIAEAERTGIWPGFVDVSMTDWARMKQAESVQ